MFGLLSEFSQSKTTFERFKESFDLPAATPKRPDSLGMTLAIRDHESLNPFAFLIRWEPDPVDPEVQVRQPLKPDSALLARDLVKGLTLHRLPTAFHPNREGQSQRTEPIQKGNAAESRVSEDMELRFTR